jgi:putative hemolysin
LDPDPLSILQIALPVFTPVALDYFISVLLLLLIIMNAIVSGSEVAYFSLSEEYSQDKYSSSDSITNKANTLLKKPENLLASLVLAYNLLNVTIAVLTIYLLNRLPYFAGEIGSKLILEAVITISIILLFVDILPKLYASHDPLKFANRYAPLITVISRLMSPFSGLLAKITTSYTRPLSYSKHELSMEDLSKALEITSDEITRDQEKETKKEQAQKEKISL